MSCKFTLKSRFIHIINVTLLFLVVLYSTPVSFLHNCEQLKGYPAGINAENSHAECFLCEIQLTSFIPSFSLIITFLRAFASITCCFFIFSELSEFNSRIANKGPPVPVF